MSYQRDEDFDSIYASIDDDDLDEMYVDVSSTSQTASLQGPSPYVYPQASQPPPSPSVRKLPPLPVKSTIVAASKPPWPRPAPQPPEDQESIKINTAPKSSDQNRNVPLPLPRSATMKKKDANMSIPKYKQVQLQQQATNTGYRPPPSVIPANRQGTGQSGYPKRGGAAVTRYQDIEIYPANTQANKKLIISPPQNSPPPPPGQAINRQDFAVEEDFPTSRYTLNPPNVNDNSEYESLRPARNRLRRGYGQQSRRSHQYSDDQIPLQDVTSGTEDRRRNGARQKHRERKEDGEDDIQSKSDNSRIVCILLTIIVVALLISLMSLAMSLYTLTRFQLFLQSNNAVFECDMNDTNCTMVG